MKTRKKNSSRRSPRSRKSSSQQTKKDGKRT
jgi:hypothetical protein